MSSLKDKPRIALVHDWLLRIGGAERVLKALHHIFPKAPIYSLFYNKNFTDEFLPNAKIIPSFIQKFPFFSKTYKLLLPLMPVAAESFDLRNFDIVISSSIAFSKGLILKPSTIHISYCHSPTRFLWNREQPSNKRQETRIVSVAKHFLRLWDKSASARVDYFIANSENTARRIKKYYGRESTVIYPPVEIGESGIMNYELRETKNHNSLFMLHNSYYLIVSQLHPHKNIEIAVDAFEKLNMPLVVIGTGPLLKKLKTRNCKLKTINFLGYQPDDIVYHYLQNCRAFIMPQEEDFGIAPIEALKHGKPVLALRRGGALEYIQEGINGEFFDSPHPAVLADGIRRLNENYQNYNPEIIKKTAEQFSHERFKDDILNFLKQITI